MNQYLEKSKNKFLTAVDHIKKDIGSIRTGRATPAILENITVEAYETKTPLNQLASITTPEPRMLMVQPWDKSIIKEIEKSIRLQNPALNPVNEGAVLRINLPPLTEENRKELVKILKGKIEQGKQQVRHVRDEVREEISEAEKNKQFSQDDKFRFQKELDDYSQTINDQIKKLSEDKEKEIMTL